MKPIEIALTEYAVHDILGPKSNPEVLDYYAKIGHSWVKDDDTAWCAAFMGYCLETAGVKSTKSLSARSYLSWGKPTTTPKLGDLVILWRISPTSVYGHVGFYIAQRNGLIYMLSGNQNDQVDITGFPPSRVLGYRTI